MTTFNVILVGDHRSLNVGLPFSNIGKLADAASRTKFLVGRITASDESGVQLRVMIAANRIQCAMELD